MTQYTGSITVDIPLGFNASDRAYGVVEVPDNIGWKDNVLALKNNSVRSDGAAGNAALAFLNAAGVEVGAFGYSRDPVISPNGWFPNLMYAEIGSAFGATITDFAVVVTNTAQGKQWKALKISGQNGDVELGDSQNIQQLAISLVGCKLRIRERDHINDAALSININDAGQKDNADLAAWVIRFGAGLNELVIRHAPAGSAQLSTLFRVGPDGIVVGSPAGGAKGPGTINAQTIYKNGVAL